MRGHGGRRMKVLQVSPVWVATPRESLRAKLDSTPSSLSIIAFGYFVIAAMLVDLIVRTKPERSCRTLATSRHQETDNQMASQNSKYGMGCLSLLMILMGLVNILP